MLSSALAAGIAAGSAVTCLCFISLFLFRYFRLKRRREAVLPMNIDKENSLRIKTDDFTCSPTDTTLTQRSIGSFSLTSLSSRNGSWSPEQNRIIASHYTGVTPKVSYHTGGRTAPWAPKMSHLHTHAEESGGDVFTELFGNDVRDSYEANSGVDFDYILHDSCVSYLRQWVRHVQLSNNALRLKHGMPRAVAPPVLEALLTRGLTVATCGTDLRKAAVRYAADLIASNKKLRNSSLNGCKTDSVKLAEPQKLLLSPIKKRNKVAADVENDTDQCAPQTPAVMKQFNQIDITEINQEELTGESLSHIIRPLELGYSVSRYYVNPVCHVDHNYNTSDINRNQPHPSDLVILKKNLFS